jgi:hypothetical protein
MLLAAYSFDESGDTVTDYSGNGNTFSLTGTTAAREPSGHTNGGLATVGDTAAVLPDIGRTDDRTVMAWAKGTGLPTCWFIQWNASAVDSGAWGILYLAGEIHIQARNLAGSVRASAAYITDGDWHHYAGTYDGTDVRLYIDGELAATTALTAPIRTDTDPPVLFLSVTETAFLDDLRIYDEALDDATISALMATPVTELIVTGAADLSAEAELTADVIVTAVASTSLAASSALTVSATVTAVAAVSLVAASDLGALSRITAFGVISLSASSALTVAGRVSTLGSVALTGSSDLSTAALVSALGHVALSAVSHLVVSLIGARDITLTASLALTWSADPATPTTITAGLLSSAFAAGPPTGTNFVVGAAQF